MIIKKPWERRLKDLAQLYKNCNSTYFNPELFRMNLNQFLQTSRTITFIIQKNKSNINDFNSWYKSNVLDNWLDDETMTWAKNSRNTIEKEGDLEMFSTLKLTLICSYLKEEDIAIKLENKKHINFGIKKLVRFAQKKYPSGVSNAAVIRVERRWVANSLPSYELLHALSYIYSRIYEVCYLLGKHIDSPLDSTIQSKGESDTLRVETLNVSYFKLNDYKQYHVTSIGMTKNNSYKPPKELVKALGSMPKITPYSSLSELVECFSKTAKATFDYFGNHNQMLFMFDEDYNTVDMVSTIFGGQEDKFIFWRAMAERASSLKVCSVIWISEAWLRKPRLNLDTKIGNMEIIGEKLQVFGLDSENNQDYNEWNILRENENEKPILSELIDHDDELTTVIIYYLVPLKRALGISEADIFQKQ